MKHFTTVLLNLILFTFLTLNAQNIPPYVPDSGLAGWWPFTGNALDSSGNGDNGSINGASLTTDRFGRSNGAYNFNGNGNRITFSDTFVFHHNADASISVWLNLGTITNSAGQATYVKSNLSSTIDYNRFNFFIRSSAGIILDYRTNNSNMGSNLHNLNIRSGFQTNKWHHVVYTRKGNIYRLYINGRFVNSVTDINPSMPTAVGWLLGDDPVGNLDYPGKIDDLGLWKRALSDCEIRQLYLASLKPSLGSLLAETLNACGSDSVLISAAAGLPDYKWSNGKNGRSIWVKQSDRLALVGTDTFGCKINDSILVSIMKPVITPKTQTICPGDTAHFFVKDSLLNRNDECGYMPYRLLPGLKGWYPLCGNAAERFGNGPTGTVAGAVLAADRFGNSNKAYRFDGVNDYIRIGEPFDLLPRTFSLWFNAASIDASFRQILTTDNKDLVNGMTVVGVRRIGGADKVIISAGLIMDTTDISTNLWYHVAIMVDSFSTVFYLNGVEVFSTPSHSDYHSLDVNANLVLGASRGMNNSFFAGSIDDIAVWNRILSKEEIKLLISLEPYPVTYTWSVPDTGFSANTVMSKSGKVYLKAYNGISFCTDSASVVIGKATLNLPDTILFTACSRDSMRISCGPGWSSVSWSNGDKDSISYLKTTGNYSVFVENSSGCDASDTFFFYNPGMPQTAIAYTDSVNCFGGKDGRIIASSSGGFTPYFKSWSNTQTGDSATGLLSGSYRFILEDAFGCRDTATGIVFQPTKVKVAIANTDSIRCAGDKNGSISAISSGGIGSHRYIWNDATAQTVPTAVGLPAGAYKVIVTDAYGCKDSANAILYQPLPVSVVVADADSVKCFGEANGRLTALVSGGSGSFSYQWNDPAAQTTAIASGLRKGTYIVIATDKNNCRDSVVGIVHEPLLLRGLILSVDSVSCAGYNDGSIQASGFGGTLPYRFSWNTSPVQQTATASGLSKGSYTVTVTDRNNCSDTVSAYVYEGELPLNVKIVTRLYAAKGDVIDLKVVPDLSGYQYKWQLSGPFGQVFQTANPRFRIEETSTVTVEVSSAAGCKGYDTTIIMVILPLDQLMPNVFSPNGDGKNDYFGPPDMFEVIQFDVYNRWGELIFKGSESNRNWDGSYQGETVTQGMYLYIITASLKGSTSVVSDKGMLEVLR